MFPDNGSAGAMGMVNPGALIGYATGLGWRRAPAKPGDRVAILVNPNDALRQILVATDRDLDDYTETVANAVGKLAEFEGRGIREVLDHLLLPPADVLRLREVAPGAETGSLPLEHAVRLLGGASKMIRSSALSVLLPQRYHPRLSRAEADELLNRCRFGQTERGSFVLNIACPLYSTPALPGMESDPFARRVVLTLMDAVDGLSRVAETNTIDDLLGEQAPPGISANLCEALLSMRPEGESASVSISSVWSRTRLPASREYSREVRLTQDVFDIVEEVVPHLRSSATPREMRFFGFVEALSGQREGEDVRPRGEVDFLLLLDQEGEVRARGLLDPEEYEVACQAHLRSAPVSFKGTLRRLVRSSRIDDISDFAPVRIESPKPPEPVPV
jgi:hypothetical protein